MLTPFNLPQTLNPHQVAISLSGGEITYFELDPMGQLLEMAKRDIEGDVTCLDLAPVPPGLQRCRWAEQGRAGQGARSLGRGWLPQGAVASASAAPTSTGLPRP
jgi:splicing factor 3B subunit 3